MSTKYPGGFITKSPVAPTTAAASGVWTLDQQQQYQKAGTWPAPPNYIEEVFSTYLYTGNGTSQTITNGIDLSTKGGLVWVKSRSSALNHLLVDTARGANRTLASNTTAGQIIEGGVTAFNTTGFDIDNIDRVNTSSATYASWTFRKQPKFFDVVTYTGDGLTGKVISHSLGSTPGCIIFKRTDSTSDWAVYHRSLNGGVGPEDYRVFLNTTAAQTAGPSYTVASVSSTSFTLGSNGAGGGSALTNVNGATYVAYVFAHNAGGFGLTGTDNVISCGSFTTDAGGNFSVSLGYEPQLVIVKRTNAAQNWFIADTMRGFSQTQFNTLIPNLSAAEITNASNYIAPNATGFGSIGNQFLSGSASYIYIAIRRGPMKVPTDGTSVFSPIAANNAQGTQNTTGFPVDLQLQAWRDGVNSKIAVDRLRGVSTTATNSEKYLVTDTTAAEASNTILTQYWNNTGFQTSSGWASASTIYWNFGRAPGFFDEVCYTGTGTAGTTQNHNLGVVPELVILKQRSAVNQWIVMSGYLNAGVDPWAYKLVLNSTGSRSAAFGQFNGTAPTATQFTLGSDSEVNASGGTYVAYLFATLAGVSKVGTYTGTGATQTISCGFSGGARFVLIKNAESTGDWYVWDTARGMVAGTDPSLLLNSTAAEVNANSIYTTTGGFQIVSTAAGINASGGTYIFLAIA